MTDKDYPTISEIHNVSDLPLIVYPTTGTTVRVTVEVEQTCATCHYWKRFHDGARGTCSLHEESDEGAPVSLFVYGEGEAEYFTPEAFSCSGHQPRPDEDARE